MRIPLKIISVLTVFLFHGAPQAQAQKIPDLQPLLAGDVPKGCGCSFGEEKGVPLIYWSWENDRQGGVIRETETLRKLILRSEKYFPAPSASPRPGDRMTLQLANGDWSVQTINEVLSSCAPKAKSCKGTDYRSHLILQWQGRHRMELDGWGRCGCS